MSHLCTICSSGLFTTSFLCASAAYRFLLFWSCSGHVVHCPLSMALPTTRGTLPSDPEFLLEYLDNLPNEPESDDDFEGFLEPDDGPIAHRSGHDYYEPSSSLQRSHSLDSLLDQGELITDSPLPEASPSSPMQGQYASGSPLASPSLTHLSLPRTSQVFYIVYYYFFKYKWE